MWPACRIRAKQSRDRFLPRSSFWWAREAVSCTTLSKSPIPSTRAEVNILEKCVIRKVISIDIKKAITNILCTWYYHWYWLSFVPHWLFLPHSEDIRFGLIIWFYLLSRNVLPVNFFLPFVRSFFLYFLLRFRNRIHHREVEMRLCRLACSPVSGCQSDNKTKK